MNVLYDKPDILTVSYNPQKNYILFDWTSFFIGLEDIKEAHQKALNAAKSNKCFIYIAETSKVKNVLSQEIVNWFGTWVPKLAEYKLKAILTVVPKSSLAGLSTKSWQKNVVAGITTIDVKSLADAEEEMKKI
jgi:isopentenyl diphosphate isomerase/L-lactate dehydrogenase-like FMN-dependent dehydrogenase